MKTEKERDAKRRDRLYPHEMLEGMNLPNGWRVVRKLKAEDNATGGQFSCGYLAEHEKGAKGYLKALDFFSRLHESDDPARALEPLLRAFNFERDLLYRCGNRRLSRIVLALDDGAITVSDVQGPSTVQYIIFELADGDVRSQIGPADDLDVAWALRSLHQAAVGLEQLHLIGTAHQDLKPSNVLLFDERASSKLADLGRAATREGEQPDHCQAPVAGDLGYAPPELLYRSPEGSWDDRRIGCDLYHLGSMIASMFTTVGMTPLIMMGLAPTFRVTQWRGSYTEVLPYVQAAFTDAISYVENEIPKPYRRQLVEMLSQLCDPDPVRRGDPKDKTFPGNEYSVRRYIAKLDLVATQAEYRFSGTGT